MPGEPSSMGTTRRRCARCSAMRLLVVTMQHTSRVALSGAHESGRPLDKGTVLGGSKPMAPARVTPSAPGIGGHIPE